MIVLSDQDDIDKSGIPFYIKESSDSFDPKDLVQLRELVNQDNFDVPSFVNKEVHIEKTH